VPKRINHPKGKMKKNIAAAISIAIMLLMVFIGVTSNEVLKLQIEQILPEKSLELTKGPQLGRLLIDLGSIAC
jgi:hypothetical protein